MIQTDFQLFGILCLILGGIFYTSGLNSPFWRRCYRFLPVMVACYFVPSLLNTMGLIAVKDSQLPKFAVDYLMPMCLVLMLLGLDIGSIWRCGGKLLLLFFIGSLGVFVGGPLALWLVGYIQPELLLPQGEDSLWRGMATLAGNWVGGTANQMAMKELFGAGDSIFAVFVTVNVVLSGIWMAILLALAPHEAKINRWLRSREPQATMLDTPLPERRLAQSHHWLLIFCLPLMLGGLAHWGADWTAELIVRHWPVARAYHLHTPFIWLVVWLTTASVLLSLTPARRLAAYGADRVGNACLYLMLAIMGLKMDIGMLWSLPWFFVIGAIWLLVHVFLLLLAARVLRLPFGYLAIASQCNLGGAASAPVVTSAYRQALVPLAVLIAVFGYAWANFIAWACGQWLKQI
ncbi:DUF819 family protein [Shewanella algae]|uniref:DUF819 family protein n=1 Tax=Shewanella algae TaxID=38313 RepID=UPI0011827D87|nr:DUF819 family protein [Shewanella algae]MBO2617233.1 DUF819 family protein [Shewanella algae]MDV2964144.1 DUF819 family protein [Shewanella algae]TVO80234.1 hypothetical protein AYI78_19970 [Shewanella algae]TVO90610.1 hypothetical protein AYI79_19975 [Shewanella algae]